MVIAGVIAFCIVLLVLAFLAPRLSSYFQKGGDKPLEVGENLAEKLPGKAGDLASKPFESGRKAVRKSGAKGREGRSKAPGP
ncbi:MAG: hypothetical protein H0V15_07650 [Solirubrobacterales bacterium]|nr:hypothetical protein [Solirubrobacterales bacterium]